MNLHIYLKDNSEITQYKTNVTDLKSFTDNLTGKSWLVLKSVERDDDEIAIRISEIVKMELAK